MKHFSYSWQNAVYAEYNQPPYDIGNSGCRTISKSVHKNRIEENKNLFDFELTEEECALLDAMDSGKRTDPDPDCVDFW